MTYLCNREESEATIRLLADRYPKCFFEDPQQRKPLKKNIVIDLQNDGIPVARELLTAAIDWYQSHFGYQYALQVGVKRVDLNGKEASAVTELEQRAAQIKIKEGKQKLSEKNLNNPIGILRSLHVQGRISTDHLRKLDASPQPKEAAPMRAKSEPLPELERVYEALDTARALLTQNRDALHTAMATAALGVVVEETRRVMDKLQPSGLTAA
jgi:sRNA-binding protein